MKYLVYSILFFSFISCHSKKEKSSMGMSIDSLSVLNIDITITENTLDNLDRYFDLDSIVVLSAQSLVGEIQRTLVADDRIFILDNLPKITCFDMQGNLVYEINTQGGGPEEFGTIVDFGLDEDTEILWLYDSLKRRLSAYDMKTGCYQYSISASYIAPTRIAIDKGSFFFHTPDHYNYATCPEMHYSLFYSVTGKRIDGRYFPHDEIAEYMFGYGGGHPFYYNEGQILYIRDFGNVVYRLSAKGEIVPLYNISIPDPLPLELVKEKPNPMKLVKSQYSWLLSKCYVCDNVLNFAFSKGGSYYWGLYDLKENRMIHVGKDQMETAFLIDMAFDGIYKESFFSVISSQVIVWKKEKFPDLIPDKLHLLSEEDNPVVVFYKVKK